MRGQLKKAGRESIGWATMSLATIALACSSTKEGEPRLRVQPAYLAPEQARFADLEDTAAAQGWTLQEAEKQQEISAALAAVTDALNESEPDALVGSELSLDPGGRPKLYIKGKASDLVLSLAAKAPVEIEIVDKQPFSFSELEGRQQKLHELFARNRIAATSAFYIEKGGRLEVASPRGLVGA